MDATTRFDGSGDEMIVNGTRDGCILWHDTAADDPRGSHLFHNWRVLRGVQHTRFRLHGALYVKALEIELRRRGHKVDREVWVTVMYKGEGLGKRRLDMVVDDTAIVEVKSTFDLPRKATRQLYNYVSAIKLDVALLLHFGPEPQFFRVTRNDPRRALKSRRRSQ